MTKNEYFKSLLDNMDLYSIELIQTSNRGEECLFCCGRLRQMFQCVPLKNSGLNRIIWCCREDIDLVQKIEISNLIPSYEKYCDYCGCGDEYKGCFRIHDPNTKSLSCAYCLDCANKFLNESQY